jgi:hypothetical protein
VADGLGPPEARRAAIGHHDVAWAPVLATASVVLIHRPRSQRKQRERARGKERGSVRGRHAGGGWARQGERAIVADFCFLPSCVVSKEIRGRAAGRRRGKEGERREERSRAQRMAAEGEHERQCKVQIG